LDIIDTARKEYLMEQDLLKAGNGRFFRGNLHCHSDRSDGMRTPEAVAAAYRDAGYDFIALSDHFEAVYGWRVTDTRALRDDHFTTIVGAELSSAPWGERYTYWVTAVGLPTDFAAPPADNHAEAITRAKSCGAFVTLLHPGINNLPLEVVDTLPAFDTVDAVEIYNHNRGAAAGSDQGNGVYMLEGLLELGCRVLVSAGDDAHFIHPRDRFGGWVQVYCERLDPQNLLSALLAGHYYATQGPALRELRVEGARLHVETSATYAISLSGRGDLWQSAQERIGEQGHDLVEADFDLSPFRGSYCRVTVVDAQGRRAWSNPIWP
jgi:hypothetical protein